MSLFKIKNKDDLITVKSEQFGLILSETILLATSNYSKFFDEINLKKDIFNYLTYLQYLLYISQELLKRKYQISIVERVIDSSIYNIIELLECIDEKSKNKFINYMNESYKLIKNEQIDIFSTNGIKEFSKNFQNDLETSNDPIIHHNIVLEFTSFLKFHSESILNDKIIIE